MVDMGNGRHQKYKDRKEGEGKETERILAKMVSFLKKFLNFSLVSGLHFEKSKP